MGTQVVLHRKNEEASKQRNETRNLGLQSIVNREDTITAQLINDASKQLQATAQIKNDIQRLQSIMSTLTWAANQIYNVIENAYMSDTSKTQKFVDIQKGAFE